MSKIARYQGNVRAFASDAQGLERTVFGGTNQADDLTSQITASFLRGWGIVGASEHPSLEDFNAAMYAMSQFIAYQHQMGVPEWHSEQEYHIGSICTHDGESYQSLLNANVGSQPPSAKWTPVLTSKNGLSNLGLRTAAKADVVGTVSQSGGVPTGAIIERGSNSNGEYTKFADGTLICCFTKSVESITSNPSGGTTNLYFSTESVFTFPATFVGTRPAVAPSAPLSTGGTSSWPSVRGSSLTGTSLALISNVQNAAAYLGYTAVGRWF